MIETILEYQLASALYRELLGARGEIAARLNARKGDIELTATLGRITADLRSVAKVIENHRPAILLHIEQKHGVKFQWLIQPAKPSADGVVKMTPSS